MRVLIRERRSSRFLANPDRWVARRGEALDFVTSVMALNAATRMDLKDIEIVLDFGQARDEVVLNVPAEITGPPRDE